MYVVNITQDGGGLLAQESVTQGTTFTRSDLLPFTMYSFEVAAVTGGGTGDSISIDVTTNEAGMAL